MSEGKKVALIHSGYLNSGHHYLIDNGFNIYSIIKFQEVLNQEYDFVFIDEAQRLDRAIIDQAMNNEKWLVRVFSHDPLQVMSEWEERSNSSNYISTLLDEDAKFELTKKIRTNEVLSDFIICLLDRNLRKRFQDYSEFVKFRYFEETSYVVKFSENLRRDGWIVINPSNSRYSHEIHDRYIIRNAPSSHFVIGQEFDKVAIIVPRTFKYNVNGKLMFIGKSYYKAEKMFYQAITRCRNQLMLIIDSNEDIFERVIDLV